MLKLKIYAIGALGMPESVLEAENTMELLDPYLKQSPVTGQYKGIYGRMRRAARYTGLPMWGILRNKALQSSAWLCDQMVRNGFAEWIEFNADEFNPQIAIRTQRAKRLATPHTYTPEQNEANRQRTAKRWQNMTEEQRKEMIAKQSAGWVKRREKIASGEIEPHTAPMSEERKRAISEQKKAKFAAMTEEEKAIRSAKLKAGWAARRERLAAERKANAERIEQERAQRHAEHIYRNKVRDGRIPNADEVPDWFVKPTGFEVRND